MIVANDLKVSKDGINVMSIKSFRARKGEITGIAGPSGSGKSTLLNCLGLLDSVDEGKIFINNIDYTNSKIKDRSIFWREKAAFIFQDYGIIDEWSAEENVALKEYGFFRRKTFEPIIRESLDAVGLKNRYSEKAARFSGGEKQRISIARALSKSASFIYADEPTASLDAENRRKVINLLRSLAEGGSTVIVATHDEDLILSCDSVFSLQ